MIRRFNRYELKYIMTVSKARCIMEDLKSMTDYDAYGGNYGYPITSLYYDSPQLDCYWAKIEGIKFRRKLRIRIYPKDPIESTAFAMVEIKQRINQTVQKKRVKLPIQKAYELCAGVLSFDNLDAKDSQVVNEIKYLVDAMNLKPRCITAYHRKAFVGSKYEPGLRITFDTGVSYRTTCLKVTADARNLLVLPLGWTIMEVKVDEAIPIWVTSLLARYGCRLQRVSKYCAGVAKSLGQPVIPLAMFPVPKMNMEEITNG